MADFARKWSQIQVFWNCWNRARPLAHPLAGERSAIFFASWRGHESHSQQALRRQASAPCKLQAGDASKNEARKTKLAVRTQQSIEISIAGRRCAGMPARPGLRKHVYAHVAASLRPHAGATPAGQRAPHAAKKSAYEPENWLAKPLDNICCFQAYAGCQRWGRRKRWLS